MVSISKEEIVVIDKMFSWCASDNDRAIIKQSIYEVKNGNGLYMSALKCNADLFSLKSVVSERTGLDQKTSGELSRVIWRLVQGSAERERMIKAGIEYGLWVYEDFLCDHPSHAALRGMKFPLAKGAKIGILKRIFPQQLVGCGCSIKPVLPF